MDDKTTYQIEYKTIYTIQQTTAIDKIPQLRRWLEGGAGRWWYVVMGGGGRPLEATEASSRAQCLACVGDLLLQHRQDP